jgi:hypothetical protein
MMRLRNTVSSVLLSGFVLILPRTSNKWWAQIRYMVSAFSFRNGRLDRLLLTTFLFNVFKTKELCTQSFHFNELLSLWV